MKKIIPQILDIQTITPFLWVAAFICALYPVNDWQLWLFAAACMTTFAWSFLMLSNAMTRGLRVPKSPVLYLAGAFWILATVSVFWSDIKPISLMAICFFSVMPLTFFSSVIGGNDDYFKKIAALLTFIFAILSFWAVIQFFFLNNYFSGQARHPLADPSSLGALLSMAFFCSIGWMMGTQNAKTKKTIVVFSSLLLCGILSTVARGPVFAMIPAMALMGWMLWPQVKAHKKQLGIVFVTGLLFYGLMQTNVQKNLDLGERLYGTFAAQEYENNSRLNIWESSFQMIKDKPLLGTGIGTFFLYYPEYRKDSEPNTVYMAHNDPLQFWVELGILGPLLFYGFVIAAIMRTFKALSKLNEPKHSKDRIIIVSVFCALGAMVLGSHVGFNHYNLSILMGSGFLLSVWFLMTSRVLDEKPSPTTMPTSVPMAAQKGLLALPYIMVIWILFGIVAGEHYANRAAQSLFAEDMYFFASDINNAGKFSNGLNYRAYILAVNVPLAILEFKKDQLEKDEAAKLYEQATGYMQNVLAINPRSAVAYYYLAKVQTMVPSSVIPDNTPIPEDYYKKALQLDPTHLGARMALHKLYTAMQKPLKDRITLMEGGAQFFYNMEIAGDYYGELAKLYLEDKNYGKAKDIMTKARDFERQRAMSIKRQNTSIPQAIMGADSDLRDKW